MSRHTITGQTAMERSVNEQGRWEEYKAERDELEDEGLEKDEITQRLLDKPKWWPVEVVDELHEDTIIELDKLVKSEKGCALDRSVAWVAENLGNDRMRPQDAPSGTAWNLLEWTRVGEGNKSEFIKNLLSKLMPSSKDLENQARYSDDGSTIIELAERIKARMAENVAT